MGLIGRGVPLGAGLLQPAWRTSYTTNFALTESPISERGMWNHNGLDWTTINTSGGLAYGTQTGSSGGGGFDDSTTYLQGFGPNQSASIVIQKDPALSSCCHEFQCLVRWADSAHFSRGYECGVAFDGSYSGIVRWNGAYGDFTTLVASGSIPGGISTGDVIMATAIGNVITVYHNGTQFAQVTDSTWADGNPGFDIFHRNAASTVHGITSFTAKTL